MVCDSHEGGIYDYAKVAYEKLKNRVNINFFYFKKSGAWEKLKFYKSLLGRLLVSGKDVVVDMQCLIWPVTLFAILIKKIKGFKLILEMHDEPFSEKMKYRPMFIRKYIMRSSDVIVTHSVYGKNQCKEIENLPEVRYIPFGPLLELGEKLDKNKIKKKLGVDGSKVGLFFGIIQPNKGLDVLLKAVPHVVQKIKNFKLIVVGPAKEDFAFYEDFMSELGIENCVEREIEYVPLEKAGPYFVAADLVILPYREITQSAVPFAAYVYKKPVIASDVGGVKEVVRNGVTGLLVRKEDHEGLARCIVRCLKNNTMCEKMGVNGYNLITKGEFSWDNIVKSYLTLFEEIS
jgi:glycosyltransferase involved in cell wall biosynthesis